MIGIVDYGAGNLASVKNALGQLGHDAAVFDRAADTAGFDRIILPGVGSFRQAMQALDDRGWTFALRGFAASGRPLLGVCLGMQLLFDEGDEHGLTRGLGLVPGRVLLMTPAAPHRVPHVGWNNLIPARRHPLLQGLKPHVDLYFVHSYHADAADAADVIARCDHGGEFVAAVARGNVAGMQFHPEKSQPSGLRILDNFAAWNGSC